MFKELAQDFIMKQVSNQIEKATGIDANLINKVTDEWLGSMILWLAKNAGTPEWAEWLFNAIKKDHDGSILDNVEAVFAPEKQEEGNKILDHILGNKKNVIETQIWKDTGLNISQVSSILKTVAPLVLGMLGKQTKEKWFGLDDIVGLISNEKEEVTKKWGLWIFGSILDQDGDGDFDAMDAFKLLT